MLAEQLGDRGDGGVGALKERMAVLRIADRGREHLGERERAVVAQQQHPGLEGAGHAGGKEPGAGDEVETLAAIVRDRRAGRRRALAADHFRLAAPHVVDDDRRVAARAVEMRLDHLQGERRGHGGVEGVAALLQGRHADRGGDPVRRGDDAEGALDLRTGGERVRIDEAHASACSTLPAGRVAAGGKNPWGAGATAPSPRLSRQLDRASPGANFSATPFMQ